MSSLTSKEIVEKIQRILDDIAICDMTLAERHIWEILNGPINWDAYANRKNSEATKTFS